MKLTITKLVEKSTKKDGTPFVWPSGDKYSMFYIKTREHGDTLLSCPKSGWNQSWKEGSVVEAVVEESVSKGVTYLNLKKPDPTAGLLDQVNKLAERVASLEAWKESFTIPNNTTAPFFPNVSVSQAIQEKEVDPELPF